MSETQQLTPDLMFQNSHAEEAMNYSVELFGSKVVTFNRYGVSWQLNSTPAS